MVHHQNGAAIRKRLLTWSIDSIYDVTESEYNIPILFYGTVYLHVATEESENGFEYKRLHIIRQNGRTFRKLYRATNADNVRNDVLYYLTFVGVYTESEYSKTGWNLDLYNQRAIRFIEIF